MERLTQNKKAIFEYFIIETFMAGIQLVGTEVKSIIDGKVSITEAYCHIRDGEIFIKNMHISEYKHIGYGTHEPLRDRKLLLNRKEINKLTKLVKEKGLSIIPLSINLSKTGFIKIEIALAKGKKLFSKKESIKEKDLKREKERYN